MIAKLIFSAVYALLGYVSYIDIARLRIPNAVSLGVAGLFLPFAPAVQMSLDAFLMHLAAGSSMLAVGFILFSFGMRFGGGDVKLFAALSLWCGFAKLLPFFIVMCFAGGALALLILTLRQSGVARFLSAWGCQIPTLDMDLGQPCVPYAPAMAVSFIYVTSLGFAS